MLAITHARQKLSRWFVAGGQECEASVRVKTVGEDFVVRSVARAVEGNVDFEVQEETGQATGTVALAVMLS